MKKLIKMKRIAGITDISKLEDFEIRFRATAVCLKAERINESKHKPASVYGTPIKYTHEGLVDSIGPVRLQYNADKKYSGLGKHPPPKKGYNREILPEIMKLNNKFEYFGLGVYAEMINIRLPKGIGRIDQGYAVEYDSQNRIILYGEVNIKYDGTSKVPIKVGPLTDTWGFW